MLLDPEYIGIAIQILLLSCLQAEIDVISYPLPVTTVIFEFSFTLTSDSTNIWPKKYADSVEIFHISHLQFQIQVLPISCFHVRYYDFRLNADRISASTKTNTAMLNLLQYLIYAL